MNIPMRLFPVMLLALTMPVAAMAEEEKALNAEDLFGGGGGYFHPYVTVSGMYDDNVYNTSGNKVSDYATTFSPGIWLALPGVREKAPSPVTSPRTTGGVGVVEDHGDLIRRLKAFLHYRSDMTRYDEVEDKDTDDQLIEGLLQYSFRGGLSFELVNQYKQGHEDASESISGAQADYTSNLFGTRVNYDVSSRVRLRGEYSNFDVNYDTALNDTRSRNDSKYSGYAFYKLSGKSSVFIEYDFVDISYDISPDLDSSEHYVWAGYRHRFSEKTMGEVKGGYLTKDYERSGVDSWDDFVLKGWLDYAITGKSRLKLTLSRNPEEPDRYDDESSLTNAVNLTLNHDLTRKIMLSLDGGYSESTYEGQYVYGGVSGERKDDKYTGKLSMDYRIQDWLGVGASYTYTDRESTFSNLSYTDNTFMLTLTLAM